MTTKELTSKYDNFQLEFADDVNDWFIQEMGKVSKKYNVYVEHFGILRIYDIDGKWQYEPWNIRYESDRNPELEPIVEAVEAILQVISGELDFCYQGLIYTDEYKSIQ